MKSSIAITCLLLSAAWPLAAEPDGKELIYLGWALDKNVSASELNETTNSLSALRNDPARSETVELARRAINDHFKLQYIRGTGSDAETMATFSALELSVAAFGSGQEGLVGMLSVAEAPGAWENASFVDYVKRKLMPLPLGPRSQSVVNAPSMSLDREAFLVDVCPANWQAAIMAQFHAHLWDATPAEGMDAVLLAAKEKNAMHDGFHRLVVPVERKAMGNRLFDLGVNDWPKVHVVLEELVQASDHPPAEWHRTLANALHDDKGNRSAQTALVLNRLTALQADANVALNHLDCMADNEWLEWLHANEAVQAVFKLRDGGAVRTHLVHHLRRVMEAPEEFKRFYRWIGATGTDQGKGDGYYYHCDPNRVFDSEEDRESGILRAHARLDRTPGRDQITCIIGDALEGCWSPDHRATLGNDLLSGFKPLSLAWEKSPTRIELALGLYITLQPVEGLTASQAQHELDRPLLCSILRGTLAIFRSGDAKEKGDAKKVLGLLSPYLLKLKEKGGEPDKSQALRDLNEEVLRLLRESRGQLELLTTDADLDAMKAPIDDYVEALKLALEFHRLLIETKVFVAPTPGWLRDAAKDLQIRVFGLPEKPQQDAVFYWPRQEAEFRARILSALDAPLRGCFPHELASDGALFFEAVYLPLLRVHGFTKVLDGVARGKQVNVETPQELWIKALAGNGDAEKAALNRALEQMNAPRFLDADSFLLRLVKLRLALIHVGKTVWQLPPKEVFGPVRLGTNANLRLLKSLLDEKDPVVNETLQLSAITETVLDQLRTHPPVNGPVFPATADTPDSCEPIADYLPWAENLVTALEWRQSPARNARGPVPWTNLVKVAATLKESKRDTFLAPFAFSLPKLMESREKVRGNSRLQLVNLWLSAGKLGEAAHAAQFLPNHSENNAEPGTLPEYQAARQKCYTRLVNERWNRAPVLTTLRALMRLSLSARAPLTPAYSNLRRGFRQAASSDWHGDFELRNIDAEQSLIEQMLGPTTGDPTERVRRLIDGCTDAQLPKAWSKAPPAMRSLIASNFQDRQKRLNDLSESALPDLLQLRIWLRELGGTDEGHKEAKLAAEDGERIRRFLDYLDYILWFTRADFSGSDCLFSREKRAEAREEDAIARKKTAKQSPYWYPAVALFGLADASLLRAAIESTKGELQDHLKRTSYLLDDAAYRVLLRVSEQSPAEAQDILSFSYSFEWQSLDFRLLCERRHTEEVSGTTLVGQALNGILRNFEFSGEALAAQPNDAQIYDRLFKCMDAFLPGPWLRNRNLKDHPTLDDAVYRAACWNDGHADIPEALKTGANGFLADIDPHFRLLRGARTLKGGVLPALDKLATRCGEVAEPSYQLFYINALFAHDEVSDGFYNDLAEPLLRQPMASQRGEFDALINSADVIAAGPKADHPLFEEKLRTALPSAVEPLVKGWEDRTAPGTRAQDYLWRPADELAHLGGVQESPPEAFLDLVRWWMQHEDSVKDPKLRSLFSLER